MSVEYDQIGVCQAGEVHASLELVLRLVPVNQRGPWVDALAGVRNEPLGPFDALVVARRNQEVVAACWGQPQAGKGCSLWLPQVKHGRLDDRLAESLMAEATRRIDLAGLPITQTLSEQSHSPLHGPLTRCGFQRTAELQYLQWLPGRKPFPPHSIPLEHQSLAGASPRVVQQLVSATYEQTLDFPELDGVRPMRDVLHGYRSLGKFRPDLWRRLRLNGQDAGVLLMAHHPASNQLELVYVGVLPAARGHRLGAAAVALAQQTAIDLGVDQLVLAVDARNTPAKAIYKRAGLRSWASRYAYLRIQRDVAAVG